MVELTADVFLVLVFAHIRYTWSLLCQNQLHTKNKYKTHARNPPIGQPHIVQYLILA